MASRNQVRVVDHGADALMERMKLGGTVDVGVQGSEAGAAHEQGHGSSTTVQTVVEVATIHEFGDPENGIPRRSFIRDYVDLFRRDLEDRLRRLGQEVIKGQPMKPLLEQFGLVAVGEIQTRIANKIPPPNSKAWADIKGSDTPLIDTGQLRSSITHKVETRKGI